MNTFELQDFNKRIGLNTDLKNISEQICNKYNLGNFVSNELITIGYEDYNYYLTTSKGKYCVKIFIMKKIYIMYMMKQVMKIHLQKRYILISLLIQ